MRTTEPWLVCPKLTLKRLEVIAQEIARVRAEVLAEHRPEVGDDAWSLGCRAYRRTCYGIARLALDARFRWLEVQESGLSCMILIEGEPIRFFCGEALRPSSRSLRRGLKDLMSQGRFAYFEEELAAGEEGWFWLIAIETNDDGAVLRVVVLQANPQGEVRNLWEVPLEAPIASLAAVSSIVREPVDLPPPPVGTKQAVDSTASAGTRKRTDGSRG